jgi:Flp pilus assembly protein TadB
MPAQYNQNWTRGFGPWFTGPASDQHLRVSDAERQAVADRLAEHFSSGRLDQAEFDERVGRAMSAKTRADLNGLFDDLPETGAPAATDQAGQPRRRHRHPILLAALIVFVAIAAAHVVWPLLWIGFLVAIVLFATGTFGHGRSGQRR